MRSKRRPSEIVPQFLARYAIVALLGASAAMNVALANELRVLKGGSRSGLREGAAVAPISAVTLKGRPQTVDFAGDRPTVLYYFSRKCGWCQRNWANVRHLVEQASGRFKFVGLSAASNVADLLQVESIRFDVLTGLDDRTLQSYNLAGTPQTIVVSPDGRVLKTWSGAYVARIEEEVERYFAVNLPGLTEPSRK